MSFLLHHGLFSLCLNVQTLSFRKQRSVMGEKSCSVHPSPPRSSLVCFWRFELPAGRDGRMDVTLIFIVCNFKLSISSHIYMQV